jgi:hypothetical protein
MGLVAIASVVVGIAILLIGTPIAQSIGLTVIFGAMLIYAGIIVNRRLELMGAEDFAVGSIIVWSGFFLAAFPIFAFAWGFLEDITRIWLLVIGVFLVLIGFTTNYYDLNVRMLEAWNRFQSNLSELLQSIRQRIFKSVWTFVAIFFLAATGLSFFPSIQEVLPSIFQFRFAWPLTFFGLAILSILIEFRSVVKLALASAWETMSVMGRSVARRLRNLPRTIYESLEFLVTSVGSFFFRVFDALRNILTVYLLSFFGTLVFGVWGILSGDPLKISGSIVLLLVTMINLLSQRPEAIGERVAGFQQAVYRRSFAIRKLVTRYSGACPQCDAPLRADTKYCSNCNYFIPDCMVCRRSIYAGEEILECPNCKVAGHQEHLDRWLDIKSTCPNCRQVWAIAH